MPPNETVTTWILYVNQYDQLLLRRQVESDRTHHVAHPEVTPRDAVACQYYDIKSSKDLFSSMGTIHNTSFNFSEFIPLPQQLASVS